MKNELDIVKDVSQKLFKLQIPFMLTGSMALNYYAQLRMTRGVDFVLELKPEQVPQFLEVFGAEYYVSPEAARIAVRNRKSFNLIHQESVIKVDCFVRPDSAYAQAEFDRRKAVRIGDFETYVASKEADEAWRNCCRSASVDDRPLDTPPEVHRLYQSMLMQLTPEERFIRGALMFDAAREMVLASLPKDLSPGELRRRLYERMYGEPLPADFPKKNSSGALTRRSKVADCS